ncbi:NADH dehydrogenase [ubiquinone] 1 alpha subcomplex subunit 11 [Thalassophryne amazonica]|uniref:NADH dehydrogenase [ubiquinone] 1 alpha subcomplex subunit 11 n=1 Tax=Thalassophryne amazonica TaxID=390379 RepID=UPI001472271B|nr:NADH dehydrogenase [ubiquinone] 1 alpha subcomplex subunit 11 [Thalassophryne amazonica]
MGYWDEPDGTDCVGKTWFTTKLAAAVGLVGSAYHIVGYQPESAVEGLQKVTKGTVVMATLGAIFGMTTCLVAEAREAPDEPLNYFIGGCASGVFLGARTHSIVTGASMCLCLGTVGFFTKVAKVEGWKIFGPPEV